jgi:hypothetical protein
MLGISYYKLVNSYCQACVGNFVRRNSAAGIIDYRRSSLGNKKTFSLAFLCKKRLSRSPGHSEGKETEESCNASTGQVVN